MRREKKILQTSDSLNTTCPLIMDYGTQYKEYKNTLQLGQETVVKVSRENVTVSNHYSDISYDKQTPLKIPFQHNRHDIDAQTKLTPE